MPLYETIFIARQDVPTTQVEALTKIFSDIIVADGGKITKTEPWGLRTMAYRINKNKKGHYVLLNIDATPAAIAEMERNMKLNEDVLRFMTIRVEEHEAGPSAIIRKEDRAPMGDRGMDRPRRAPRSEPVSEGDAA